MVVRLVSEVAFSISGFGCEFVFINFLYLLSSFEDPLILKEIFSNINCKSLQFFLFQLVGNFLFVTNTF